ncbi:hypothetical protein AACH06_25905 [Ideonella sp. DXS29W]|uniref:Uncharacterized protein n=1 Tax=Ideonella lacteola TaxID=2984193 RepID=A0ABU9BWR8_9BURK
MTALKRSATDVAFKHLVSARNCIDKAEHFFHERSSRTRCSGTNQFGTTLWSLHDLGARIHVFFDWVEVAPGVVAQSNPMGILSNVGLLGDDGLELPRSQSLLCLNTLVYMLPWQPAVVDRLHQWRIADNKRRMERELEAERRGAASLPYLRTHALA